MKGSQITSQYLVSTNVEHILLLLFLEMLGTYSVGVYTWVSTRNVQLYSRKASMNSTFVELDTPVRQTRLLLNPSHTLLSVRLLEQTLALQYTIFQLTIKHFSNMI